MLKKVLSGLALSGLLFSGAYADDILAIVSKGQLTSNSAGVKELSLEEKMQVKGGYNVTPVTGSEWGVRDEMYAIVTYSEQELKYIVNYLTNENGLKGLCGLGQSECSNPSTARAVAYQNVTMGDFTFFPLYKVKREVRTTNLGTRYVVFTYGTGVIDSKGQLYRFDKTTSSSHLNYNMLIKEVANKFKETMESRLGGWSVR